MLPGPEFELFTLAAREQLWGERWRITPQSNRMGSRLAGAELKRKRGGDMLSSGVIPGTIQVPPSGQPIILMGDAQTTGGYPRIGVVIRADLWKLAQAPLNGRLRLVQVDQPQALAAWADQQRYLSPGAGARAGRCRLAEPGMRLRGTRAKGSPTMQIDLNADLGEGAGSDEALLAARQLRQHRLRLARGRRQAPCSSACAGRYRTA